LDTRNIKWKGCALNSNEKNQSTTMKRYYEMLKEVGTGFLLQPIPKNCISKNEKLFKGLVDIFRFASLGDGTVEFVEWV